MACPRSEVVTVGAPAIYHIYSRCVRRAFLCGYDAFSGKSFEHRKRMILERLKFLVSIFCIDVLGYALMSNHVHLLLRTARERLDAMTDEEIARCWLALYPCKTIPHPRGESFNENRVEALLYRRDYLQIIRMRLGDISWFMKSLNEYVSRKANKEDECKGSFWEGRFKCQRIEDQAALLICSMYIDLNPIRVGARDTPEESKYTGAYDRIQSMLARKQLDVLRAANVASINEIKELREKATMDSWLAPIDERRSSDGFLSVDQDAYLEFLDVTGRMIKKKGTAAIPLHLADILTRIGIKEKNLLKSTENYGKNFAKFSGTDMSLQKVAKSLNKSWVKGMQAARISFESK